MISKRPVLNHLLILNLLYQLINDELIFPSANSWKEEENVLTHFGIKWIDLTSNECFYLVNESLASDLSDAKGDQTPQEVV